jgi:hypothetical protein
MESVTRVQLCRGQTPRDLTAVPGDLKSAFTHLPRFAQGFDLGPGENEMSHHVAGTYSEIGAAEARIVRLG